MSKKQSFPRLGIFWVVDLPSENFFLLISHSFDEVELVGGFRTSHVSHINEWRRAAARDRRLQRYSYEFFPRGRVNWREEDDRFLLLADANIIRRGFHSKIIDCYQLPFEKVVVMTDPHYRINTLPTLYER